MKTDKKELRRQVRQAKSQFTAHELEQMSEPLMQQLMSHPRMLAARTVMMYYSLPDEVCTHHVLTPLLQAGKRVLLPAVVSDTEMELRCYEREEDLQVGPYNIMEPVGRTFTDYAQIELAVIPGMAFDAARNRLGRGKGYYDRFLPLIPQAFKLGVCFPFQFMAHIPAEANDIAMDEVLH